MSVVHVAPDTVVASIAGVGTTLSLAATNPIDMSNPVSLLNLLPTILGPALVVVANRLLAARAARKRTEAAHLRNEGEEAVTNADPKDDDEGRRKLREAEALEAEAKALEGQNNVNR